MLHLQMNIFLTDIFQILYKHSAGNISQVFVISFAHRISKIYLSEALTTGMTDLLHYGHKIILTEFKSNSLCTALIYIPVVQNFRPCSHIIVHTVYFPNEIIWDCMMALVKSANCKRMM